MRSVNRQFAIGFALFFATNVVGFSVYWCAGWTPLEAFYMVVITIFGVGFGEVRELSPALRLFTAGFIITGCSVLIYTAGALVNWLTEGQRDIAYDEMFTGRAGCGIAWRQPLVARSTLLFFLVKDASF